MIGGQLVDRSIRKTDGGILLAIDKDLTRLAFVGYVLARTVSASRSRARMTCSFHYSELGNERADAREQVMARPQLNEVY
jgi:hypothetical protein